MTCFFKHNHIFVFSLEHTTSAHLFFFLSFCSGVIGSGLAIFSKHRIHDTFLYRYSLNGYPYMVSLGSPRVGFCMDGGSAAKYSDLYFLYIAKSST